MTIRVRKRDGSLQVWNSLKILRAMIMAHSSTAGHVSATDYEILSRIARGMYGGLAGDDVIDITDLHGAVCNELRINGFHAAADAYEEYKAVRDEARRERLTPNPHAMMEYIHAAKYARNTADGRRETHEETVDRVKAMHLARHAGNPDAVETLAECFDMVYRRRVLPSMRSMQFGGRAIEMNHTRMYNCAFTLCNRVRVFAEVMYCLLSGAGVGYSVQWSHIAGLPVVKAIDRSRVRHFTVPDTIAGWADAVNALMTSFLVTGEYVEFDYSRIRPEGAVLHVSGGLAPGHLPLRDALEHIRSLMSRAAGRRLRPVEANDVMCYLAEAVLSGGIRRSSLICLFSPDDSEMLYAKAHGNYDPNRGVNPQRAMANNSAVFLREEASRDQFDRVVRVSTENWGEPGFYMTNNRDWGCNPCGEIGMDPVLQPYRAHDAGCTKAALGWPEDRDYLVAAEPERCEMIDRSHAFDWRTASSVASDESAIERYGHPTGFQFCNLCEVNVAACETEDDFYAACAAAACIGTSQASFTDFAYLGPVTERIVRRDALLGVGLTGIMDNPPIGLCCRVLREGARMVMEKNAAMAWLLKINPAARCTTVKPSGTASLALGGVGSGIHPHHARRYFRRVTANANEEIAQQFAAINPHMVDVKPNGDLSITFPVQAPDAATIRADVPAAEFCEDVFTVYDCWVVPGTRGNPMLTHNVSCTCSVRPEEREYVIDLVWRKRERVAAMSFVPMNVDERYAFVPLREVKTPEDEARWKNLIDNYRPVRYAATSTDAVTEAACTGDRCEAPQVDAGRTRDSKEGG